MRQFKIEKEDWEDFLYIIKVLTKKQGGSSYIRKYIKGFNKRHKHILDKRL